MVRTAGEFRGPVISHPISAAVWRCGASGSSPSIPPAGPLPPALVPRRLVAARCTLPHLGRVSTFNSNPKTILTFAPPGRFGGDIASSSHTAVVPIPLCAQPRPPCRSRSPSAAARSSLGRPRPSS